MFLSECPIKYKVEFSRPMIDTRSEERVDRSGKLVPGCFPQETYCKGRETGPGSQNENDRQRICKSCIRLKVQGPRNPIPVSASPTRMKSMHRVHTYRKDLDLSQGNQNYRSSNHANLLYSLFTSGGLLRSIMTKVKNDAVVADQSRL